VCRRRLVQLKETIDYDSQLALGELTRVFHGLPTRRRQQSNGIDVDRGDRYAWLRVATSRFMFQSTTGEAGTSGNQIMQLAFLCRLGLDVYQIDNTCHCASSCTISSR
jgi:hypothetical protein